MSYNYAEFDEHGRCKYITNSAIELNLPYPITDGLKPEDIYFDGVDVTMREKIIISCNREFFISDGQDVPCIDGLPVDAIIAVNNTPGVPMTRESPEMIAIETIGKYHSNIIYAVFEPLDRLIERFGDQVDQAAGAARERYITSVPGQQLIYAKKEAEALAWVNREPGEYPFLTAEAGEGSWDDLAQMILARARATETALASIEALRISAKQAISNATDAATILAAADITWP